MLIHFFILYYVFYEGKNGIPNGRLNPISLYTKAIIPQIEIITKRAITPQIIRFLPSSTAFSSPPTRKINLAKPQKNAMSAKPTTTGKATCIRSINILTSSLKLFGGINIYGVGHIGPPSPPIVWHITLASTQEPRSTAVPTDVSNRASWAVLILVSSP